MSDCAGRSPDACPYFNFGLFNRVGCAPPLFLQQIIFCKIATLGMGGEGATVFVRFAFYTKEDYLKINVLVLVIRTSRSGLFWY